jgi:hypothetical protein
MKLLALAWRRAAISSTGLAVVVVLRVMAIAAIFCAGYLATVEIFAPLRLPFSAHPSLPAALAFGLSSTGALLGFCGVLACSFIDGGYANRRWLFCTHAGAFLISCLVLLVRWFGVSGASLVVDL